jgi:hypothetical protein
MAYTDRYFFTFYADRDTRILGGSSDIFECIIQQLDYVGVSEEIQAQENPVQINYQNTSDYKMQAIRGSECTLNLIATEDFELEDLYTENEREFLVLIYKNGSVIWRGFIIPDGCQEQFMFTPYGISINAVDTLGLLKNLSYVQNDGNFWLGKQSFLDIIYNCINRIAIPNMDIYTCVNIYPDATTQGDTYDPLALTRTNAERFMKDDQINPINCEEVLKAVLEEWTATIIQSEGAFYIFRPNELALSDTLVFRKYVDGEPAYDGYVTSKNLAQILGGESEGVVLAPLFHINTDQLKMIDKPYKNSSMSYRYGELQNLDEKLDNPNFFGTLGCVPTPVGPCDTITISGWTKAGVMYVGLWPTGGIIFYDETDPFDPPNVNNYYQNNNTIPLNFTATNKERLKIVVSYENPDPLLFAYMNFSITLDASGNIYYLQQDGSWQLAGVGVSDYYQVASIAGVGDDAIILSDPAPLDGNITFRILAPTATGNNIIYTNISAFVFLDFGDQVGEIHTATQRATFTHVPETIDVFNGDSPNELYVGAIFYSTGSTLTDLWERRGISESVLAEPYAVTKPFLRLAVEEIQRIYAGPFVKFDGSIFGYFNPLSVFSINLLAGKFMPLGLSYDLQSNICKATLIRIVNAEIAMDYTLQPDYGQTTRVTIKSGP